MIWLVIIIALVGVHSADNVPPECAPALDPITFETVCQDPPPQIRVKWKPRAVPVIEAPPNP